MRTSLFHPRFEHEAAGGISTRSTSAQVGSGQSRFAYRLRINELPLSLTPLEHKLAQPRKRPATTLMVMAITAIPNTYDSRA